MMEMALHELALHVVFAFRRHDWQLIIAHGRVSGPVWAAGDFE